MAGRLVTIATFDLPPNARLAQNALESAGIKSALADETVPEMDWLLSNAVGWVKVQVLEEDAQRAVAVLDEVLGPEGGPVDEEALAAEAEAAGKEEGAGLAEPAAESGPEQSALPPSERDQYARRLLFASLFSLLFFPLWFYAVYLFFKAAFGPGQLSSRGRSNFRIGTALLLLGSLAVLAFLQFR